MYRWQERTKPRKRPRSFFSRCSSVATVAIIAVICEKYITTPQIDTIDAQKHLLEHVCLLPVADAFSLAQTRNPRTFDRKAGAATQVRIDECSRDRWCTRKLDASLQDNLTLEPEIVNEYKNETHEIPNTVVTTKQEADIEQQEQKSGRKHFASRLRRPSPRTAGLSKFHQSILRSTIQRQRFVTGRYPLVVSVQENPTRKWLGLGRDKTSSTSQVLVNGTSVDRSLASYDRFQWLDDDERDELHDRYAMVSLELLAEIRCKKPAYLNVLPTYGAGSTAAARRAANESPSWDRWKRNSVLFEKLDESIRQDTRRDRLWATGFSLTKPRGDVYSVDAESGHIGTVNSRTEKSVIWPNEVTSVPIQRYVSERDSRDIRTKRDELEDALLISDGFLVPGRDKGGLRVVRNPGSAYEWSVCLTGDESGSDGWFYHRATWVDLTGDGRKSILTARAKRPSILPQDTAASTTKTQLVWLERPEPFRIDEATGNALEEDGTIFDPFSKLHAPWKVRVLDDGPDVMFSVADLDVEDGTVEVMASQFFNRKLSLHSIKRGREPRIVFRRTIDDKCGAAFSSMLANIDNIVAVEEGSRTVVDSGSTVSTLQPGDGFSHVLVTSHECSISEKEGADASSAQRSPKSHNEIVNGVRTSNGIEEEPSVDGGSLFAYRVPSGKDAWKTQPWVRTVVASGFRVKPQLSNAINPGAPGFCYTFYPTTEGAHFIGPAWKRPLIAIAGDCAESAYVFRPVNSDTASNGSTDSSARYALMCEIQCGATVGSIGIGYDDFCEASQEGGYAKIYIPCYEKDKIFVFAMGSGEEDYDSESDW